MRGDNGYLKFQVTQSLDDLDEIVQVLKEKNLVSDEDFSSSMVEKMANRKAMRAEKVRNNEK